MLGPARRGLGRLLPELDPGGAAEPAPEGIQVSQLLELVLGLLGRLSARRPLLLILEDLHWSDQSTRELVAFLIRSLRGVRVVLLATYRSDELNRRHPLRPLIAYLSADDAGLGDLRTGLALATDFGAHFIALRAYVNISDVLELLGRHQEAADAAREGMALADRVGLARSLVALGRGDLDGARRITAAGLVDYAGAMSGRYVTPWPAGSARRRSPRKPPPWPGGPG